MLKLQSVSAVWVWGWKCPIAPPLASGYATRPVLIYLENKII